MRLLIFVSSVLTLVGCFNPDYGSPSFSCGDDGACPSGYTCNLADMGCYRGEGPGSIDASLLAIDAATIDASDVDTPDALMFPDATLNDAGAPLNDLCGSGMATALTDNVVAGGTTINAGDELDLSCNGTGKGDVYFEFTLAAPKSVLIELVSTGNTNLALLSDCSTESQCSSAAGTGETLDVPFLAPGTYYIAVESDDGSAQDFTIKYTESAARPPNDDCQGAIELVGNVPLTNQTMVNATDESSGSCSTFASPDVVFSFDVPAGPNRRATITASNALTFQPLLFLDDNCPGAEIQCTEVLTADSEVLDATSLAPGRYYLWVDAVGGLPASFDISLVLGDEIPPPTNDLCSTTDTFTSGTPVDGSTTGAADDYDLSCADPDSGDTVHNFNIAADSSVLIEVVTRNSPWEPAIALRSDAQCSSGPDLYCNEGQLASRYLNVPSLGAGDYSVLVDGVDGATGDYTVSLDASAPVDTTFGYKVVRASAPYVTIDTAPAKVTLPINDGDDDDFFNNIGLTFDFTYFGSTFNSVNVSTNGYLRFGAGGESAVQSYSNTCPLVNTEPNNMIAVFWDDLYASSNDNAHRLSYLIDGVAPHRRFTVEWFDWDVFESEPCQGPCDILQTNVTHQVILHENGDIEMRYGPRVGPLELQGCNEQHLGCAATIGLKNSDGSDIDLADCNSSSIAADDVIYFVHPTPLLP